MRNSTDDHLVLFHSNDIHSRLENAARISAIINEERNRIGEDRVIAVDCGDHMDRMRMETEGSDGKVNVALLEELRYDAITLGNNEGLTYSRDVLNALYDGEHAFKVICANLYEEKTGQRPTWMLPSAVITRNGIRIALIAATANFANFYLQLGWRSTDPIHAISKQLGLVRDKADIVIVMSHLGIHFDRRMAEELDGIDLIVGGHTHHLLEEPLFIKGAMLCAAGKFGDYVGRVVIGRDEATGQIGVLSAEVIPTGAFELRSEADTIIRRFASIAGERLGRRIASLGVAMPSSPDRESPLSNLLAAGLREWMAADIGVVNAGQLLGGLPQGEVTAGKLHSLCPSPINPCLMELSGANLRTALEQSLLDEYRGKPIKGYGFRGEVLGMLAVDGLSITYDSARPAMERIASVKVNGIPLDDSKLYAVGSIDMFSFKIGYESLALAQSFHFFMPEFIRDVLERELANEGAITASFKSRWHSLSEFD
ncbi:bifunctional UDP-sugar hydrolase/5'-nucleotidase [Paenibacillus sp. HB172176]|uniref:bifunctional metallophosphatase/5'-nucleotidase n=1 Tax=Paenibacillus sp. HB172176 TaxID=2493690 RepID=UPI001439BC0A|nr:bifunctional UDP-sugar hydrolase/5'-nucleotidase [Paenibacillus sp. HB172176]